MHSNALGYNGDGNGIRAHSTEARQSPCLFPLVRARVPPPLLLFDLRSLCSSHRLFHAEATRQTTARSAVEASTTFALSTRHFLRRFSAQPSNSFIPCKSAASAFWLHGHYPKFFNYSASASPRPRTIPTSRQQLGPWTNLSESIQSASDW